MSTKVKSAVAFDRVSSDDQKRDGFSLEAQEKLSQKYAKERNLIIVKRWSVSESASKENDRSYFFEMVEFVRNNQITDVIFDKVDRACRGLKSAQVIEELVEKSGVRFHFTRDNLVIDVNSPSSDKLRFYLSVILAKYYIDNLKSEIKKGMDERLESGYWNHKAPLGYKNIRPEGETKSERGKATIVTDQENAPYVAEAFELYATGNYSVRDLTKFFNERLQNRQLTKSCVENMISNPFYYGAMKARGVVMPAKHPALISKELWDACQKMKGIRAEGHELNAAAEVAKPFMGLMRCALCSHWITGQVKRKPNGKTYIYYHCANHSCPERPNYVPQARIEEQVIQAFEPFSRFTLAATQSFVSAVEKGLDDLELYSHKAIGVLADQSAEAKASIEKIKKLHRDGVLSQKEFDEIMKTKQAQLVDVETEIQATIKADKATFVQGLALIELLRNSYDFMRFSKNSLKKAHLAKSVLSNPVLDKGHLRFSYRKPFDVLIELTSKKNWWTRLEAGRTTPISATSFQSGPAPSLSKMQN